MAEPAVTLYDLDDHMLQRIVNAADAGDVFLLRQAAERCRSCANQRTRRCWLPEGAGRLIPVISAVFPNLSELSLGAQGSLEDVVAATQQLPRLRSLHLAYNFCEDDAQRLELDAFVVPWADLQAAVATLASTLTELRLRLSSLWSAAPPEGLRAVNTGKLQRLQLTFALSDAQPLHESLGQLAAFTSLTGLELACGFNFNDDVGVWQLSTLTRLTSLGLSGANASLADIVRLAPLTGLADLRLGALRGAAPQAPGLRAALAAFPRLGRLQLQVSEQAAGGAGGTRVFLGGNLPWNATEAEVAGLFGDFGAHPPQRPLAHRQVSLLRKSAPAAGWVPSSKTSGSVWLHPK